jgi:hypothetical protein
MFEAAYFGTLEELRFLVTKRGAGVNRAEEHGLTPLMIAASRGYKSLMRSLCRELGANVNQQGLDGKSALFCAMGTGRLAVVKFLIQELGADPAHNGQQPTFIRATFGVKQYVRNFLSERQLQRGWDEIEEQQRNKEYEKAKVKERKRAEQRAANELARTVQQEDNCGGQSVEQQQEAQERQQARKQNVTSNQAPPVAATITDVLTLQQKGRLSRANLSHTCVQRKLQQPSPTHLSTTLSNPLYNLNPPPSLRNAHVYSMRHR